MVNFFANKIKKMENKMENRKQGYNPMKAVSGSVPRGEKKQTVTIMEDLKVVVNANNGVYDGAEHVRLNGEFIIDAKSVSLLIAALEGKNVQVVHDHTFFDSFILGEEGAKEIADRLEKKKKECDETLELIKEKLAKEVESFKKENIKEASNLKIANEELLQAIERFNASRRPWERKLNIE